MKSKIIFITAIAAAVFIASCTKKDSPNEPGAGINVSFSLTAGKIFNYQYSELDSLNNRIGTPQSVMEKINAINFSFGGYNDVAQIFITGGGELDTSYKRIVSGKDIYEWTDTSSGFGMMTLHNLIKLQKQTLAGIWMPLVLLSKGEGAEYVTQPKRSTVFQIDSATSVSISIEIKAKNEGFEDVTTPAGKFKAYKVKTTFKVDIPFETINLNIYTWISDDLDYIVKQEQKSVTSKVFGITLPGFVQELQSTGM